MKGSILVYLNWQLTEVELEHCISLVEPKFFLVSPGKNHELPFGDFKTLVLDTILEKLMDDIVPDNPNPPVDPEDGIVILYTSGTTGLPMEDLISHRTMIVRMCTLHLDVEIRKGEVFISWAPMFHMDSTDQQL